MRGGGRFRLLGSTLLVSAGLIAGCTSGSAQLRMESYWMDEVTAQEIAQKLQVQVPASASDVKGAYRKGFQDDQLLLAFVLPTGETDGFLAQLKPQEPVKAGPKSFAEPEPVAPFAHVGLPEPDSVAGVRTAQVCAPCAGEIVFMHVAVTQVGEKTSRVYLQGVD